MESRVKGGSGGKVEARERKLRQGRGSREGAAVGSRVERGRWGGAGAREAGRFKVREKELSWARGSREGAEVGARVKRGSWLDGAGSRVERGSGGRVE
eukprot:3935378-Rhodomonas_salina.1